MPGFGKNSYPKIGKAGKSGKSKGKKSKGNPFAKRKK